MKTLKLAISLEGLELTPEDKKKGPIEMATLVIRNIILGYALEKRGLQEDERRKYYKICDAFDKAVKEKKDSVELDDDWFGFLRKCKREASLMPSELIRRAEVLIDEVIDR